MGSPTLADRMLEETGTIEKRNMKSQLDMLDLERERGITIKSVPVRMNYKAKDGQEYILNLIDTPGHVDFTYEVSRSLAACEGAVLVVDAAQGVEAQTVANSYLATDLDLELVPVLNKIDLPSAQPDRVKKEIEDIIGINAADAIEAVSAKTGDGVAEVLERVVRDIPAPKGDAEAPLQALIFDSVYDNYKGVICYVRVFNGSLCAGTNIRFMATGRVIMSLMRLACSSLTCKRLALLAPAKSAMSLPASKQLKRLEWGIRLLNRAILRKPLSQVTAK